MRRDEVRITLRYKFDTRLFPERMKINNPRLVYQVLLEYIKHEANDGKMAEELYMFASAMTTVHT